MLYNIQPLKPVNWDDGDCYGDPIPDECKLPSELIEPYVQRFLMLCLEELAFYNTPVAEVKARMQGVRYFIGCYAGIHAEMATDNVYFKFCDVPDDELKAIAKKIFKDANEKADKD